MKNLSYSTLYEQNFDGYLLDNAPERIMQFGEGNFLRAFVNYFIDVMNEKVNFNTKVVVCQPIASGLTETINHQEGLYTLCARGFQNQKEVNETRVISCISRCLNPYQDYQAVLACADNPDLRFITCNTTEAGIAYDESCHFEDNPAASFPGKLTQLLYHRFQTFGKEPGKGFIILACELIDNNGKELEACIHKYAKQWNLGEEFITWLTAENIFCSTLVDRIVTGYPRNEAENLNQTFGYIDQLIVTSEIFAFWVIEGPSHIEKEFPIKEAGLPVIITPDHTPYKQRKVRILNGSHTAFVLGAYLAGQDIVRDCMYDEVIAGFMNRAIYDEIIPTLNLPKEELDNFAETVEERFKNPFIDHELLSITLNSTAKWRARVLPSLNEYVNRKGILPACLVASFAFYIAFFQGHTLTDDGLIGSRYDNDYIIKDDLPILQFFYDNQHLSPTDLVHKVSTNESFWGEDLSKIAGFEKAVTGCLIDIQNNGAYEVMRKLAPLSGSALL